jgi:hypothetical protein
MRRPVKRPSAAIACRSWRSPSARRRSSRRRACCLTSCRSVLVILHTLPRPLCRCARKEEGQTWRALLPGPYHRKERGRALLQGLKRTAFRHNANSGGNQETSHLQDFRAVSDITRIRRSGSPKPSRQHQRYRLWVERRGRDSNPRWSLPPHPRLAGERLQPLGHLSEIGERAAPACAGHCKSARASRRGGQGRPAAGARATRRLRRNG